MRTRTLKLMMVPLIAIIAIAAGSVVAAQPVTSDEVRSSFANMTIDDAVAAGYVPITPCIDATELPAEALTALGISASAGQGIHYLNESLLDFTLNPFEPEVFTFGPDGAVWTVEYLTPPQAEPAELLGQQLQFVAAVELDALHVWVVDNARGQFADFNDAVSCGAVATVQPADTGSGGFDARSTTPAAAWLAAVALMLAALGGSRLLRKED